MTAPRTRDVPSLSASTVGQLRNYLGNPTTDTVYSPPIRYVLVATTGNIAFTLEGDDETDTNAVVTLAVSAGDKLEEYSIREIKSSGTTATFTAFR